MMRSMFSAVSGLRAHQVGMDVIGNNIANVNTVGFKESRVTFTDLLSQTVRSAASTQGGRGGVNPYQVGMGVSVGSVDTIHTPGNRQDTGRATDLAINGDGYFMVADGKKTYYTRAAVFGLDEGGNFVNPSGLKVQGWMGSEGKINTRTVPQDIMVDITQMLPPAATESLWFTSNLDARANGALTYVPSPITVLDGNGNAAKMSIVLTRTENFNEWKWEVQLSGGKVTSGDGTGIIRLDAKGNVLSNTGGNFEITPEGGIPIEIAIPKSGDVNGGIFAAETGGSITGRFTPASEAFTSTTVYDSLGNAHDIFVTFRKLEANVWEWVAEDPADKLLGEGILNFSPDGEFLFDTSKDTIRFEPAGAMPVSITPDFSGVTQYGEESGLVTYQDGYETGVYEGFTIDSNGMLVANFSNGLNQPIAQIALSRFNNSAGLAKIGENLFETSNNSGEPQVGTAGTGGRAFITAGALEMSNVDIAREFTQMIITQRGLQANSRVITTSDEIFQELVNLKR